MGLTVDADAGAWHATQHADVYADLSTHRFCRTRSERRAFTSEKGITSLVGQSYDLDDLSECTWRSRGAPYIVLHSNRIPLVARFDTSVQTACYA
jgi:hypothetical protein